MAVFGALRNAPSVNLSRKSSLCPGGLIKDNPMTYLFTLDLTRTPRLPPSDDSSPLTLTAAYGQPVVYGSDGAGIWLPATEVGSLPEALTFWPLPLRLALDLASARHNRAALYGQPDWLLVVTADRLYLCSDHRLTVIRRDHVSFGRGVIRQAERKLTGTPSAVRRWPGLLLVTVSGVQFLFMEAV